MNIRINLSIPVVTFVFGILLSAPAFAGVANPTGLSSLPPAATVNDTDTFPICQNGAPGCSPISSIWSDVNMLQIDAYLASKSMTLSNKVIGGSNNTFANIPSSSLVGTLPSSVFPGFSGDISSIAGSLTLSLATVNASPGATTCSSITTNAKGLVTSNSNGACGGTYTAGTGLQLVGSQFSVPAAGITSAMLAAGAASGNLGFTPLSPANNLSDVSSALTSRNNLGLGSLATLSALPVPGVSTLGGVDSLAATSHNFVTGLNTSGALTTAQPAFTDLSGSASVTQITTALTTPPPIGATTANTGAFSTTLVGSNSANPIPGPDTYFFAATNVVNSGTAINIIGVGSFLKNDLASVGPGASKNSVLFYGLGVSDVSGAWTWGLNPVLNDTVGTTGDALVNEFDVNVGNASTTVYGLLLQGASTVQPTGIHPAIEVAPLDVQDATPNKSWGYGIETLGGAAAVGAYFGILTAGSTTSASQPIQFGYGNALTMSFSASSAGIFTVVPANATGAATGFATYNNGSSTANTASEFLLTTLDGTGQFEELEVGSTTARLVITNGGAGGIQISPGTGPIFVDGNTAVSCAAGTVSLSTLVVYKGHVTNC